MTGIDARWRSVALCFAALTFMGGCVAVKTAGAVTKGAVKTTAKAGGAVIDGAVDVVDDDEEDE
ncbi:MAG: hypothetical protein AAFX08_10510 [Pseudomonadota bacterium]